MGNLLTSSVGKKIIMSLTGLFLILFLVIHLLANSAYLLSEEAFDSVIDIMGSPLIVAMVPVLALGFILHILFSLYLTVSNMVARGKERYKVANKAQTDSWASKNMFVLGVIILGALVFHLSHFWVNMQYPDFFGGVVQNGNKLMIETFGNIWILILYEVWFVALWFHLTHGFWSAFHTLGANNIKWIGRLKVISYIYATLIFLGFSTIAIFAHLKAIGAI